MTPEKLGIHIRQRSNWEAVDLGFAMARHLWLQQLPIWLSFMLLVTLGLWLVLPIQWFVDWGALIIWWLKPLYDRLLLWMFSQQLFERRPTLADTCSALPGLLWKTGLFSALSWQRFSPSRSYNLPIWQLEQLRSSTRRQRQTLLAQQDYWQAATLTTVCLFLEAILFFSGYALIVLLDPSGMAGDSVDNFLNLLFHPGLEGAVVFDTQAYWLVLLSFTLSVLAIFIIEPFYVAAGFSLYLSRRNQLEAWDIEMAFRQLGQRLDQSAENTVINKSTKHHSTHLPIWLSTMLSTGLLLAGLGQSPALRAETAGYLNPQRQPVEVIDQELETVMQRPEFEQRQLVRSWVPRDKQEDQEEPVLNEALIQWLSDVFKSMLWIALGMALLLAFIFRKKIYALLKPPARTQATAPPESVLGLDVRPESLPDDIAGNAQALWEKGLHRDALSLLYRAALMQLTHHAHLSILPGHTERDILQQAKRVLVKESSHYLHDLTHSWQKIAYAHRAPTEQQAQQLFKDWQHFSKPRDTQEQSV